MSVYASTLTAPTNICWADRYSADGSDAGVVTTQHAMHYWDYGATPQACPYQAEYLCFKGDANQYQAQVRTRKRNVWGGGGEPDGGYTEWTAWSDSEFHTDPATMRGNDPNAWNFANVPATHLCQPYITHRQPFSNATNDLSVFDRIQYEFRVRQFRTSDGRHGDWAYQTLEVLFVPGMTITECRMSDDGGIEYRYDTPWSRNGGTITFKEIAKQGEADNLVKWRDGYASTSVDGKLASDAWKRIPADMLTKDLNVGDSIVFRDYAYKTSSGEEMDGRPITLTLRSKHASAEAVAPAIAPTASDYTKTLTVRLTHQSQDEYPWVRVGCRIRWTAVDGTDGVMDADSIEMTQDGATAEFRYPPMDVPLRVSAWAVNDATETQGARGATYWGGDVTVNSGGMAVWQTDARTATLAWNVQFSSSSTPNTSVEFIPGRGSVARHGLGSQKVVNVSGAVIRGASAGDYLSEWQATEQAWEDMRSFSHKEGTLRLPGGYVHKGTIGSIGIQQSYASKAATVSFAVTEVG